MKIILVNTDALPSVWQDEHVRHDLLEQMKNISLLLSCSNVVHVPHFFLIGTLEDIALGSDILDLFFGFGAIRHPGCDHGRALTHTSTQHTHHDDTGDWCKIVFKKIRTLIDDKDPMHLQLRIIRDCIRGHCIIDGINHQDGVLILLRERLFLATNHILSNIPRIRNPYSLLPCLPRSTLFDRLNRYSYQAVAIHTLRTTMTYSPILCESRHTYNALDLHRIGQIYAKH